MKFNDAFANTESSNIYSVIILIFVNLHCSETLEQKHDLQTFVSTTDVCPVIRVVTNNKK